MIDKLETVIQALNDWTLTYAPEFCDRFSVKAAQNRIDEAGGVFFYACEQAKNLNEFMYEAEVYLSADEVHACSRALLLIADWNHTLPKAHGSEEYAKVMEKIIRGGGTLAIICDVRVPLEAIRDRLNERETVI